MKHATAIFALAFSATASADFQSAVLSKEKIARCYESAGSHYSLVYQAPVLDQFGTTLRQIAGYRWQDGERIVPVSGVLAWDWNQHTGIVRIDDQEWILDQAGQETTGAAKTVKCGNITPPW